MLAGRMRVSSTTSSPPDTDADTLVVGVFDGETVAHDVDGGALQRLIDSGEARTAFRHVAVAHAAERRWLLAGLGPRSAFDGERARIAAAVALSRANEIGTRRLCWELPHHVDDAVAGAFVEGTVLAGYRFDRYRKPPADAQGSDAEPALIVMRYDGPDARGPVLGLVGKAVTFDSGGISIKPAAKMHEMKFDMSGGAAVVAAVGAIARLRLPVRVIGVVGATENMPSGRAMRPGDIVTAANGTTIEINNTDAEGRLVLGDCMTHAIELGAERLVDIATLTGGIVTALGSAFAGVMSNDDAWCGVVEAAGVRTGERLWRLPLDPAYDDAIKGQYADIMNATTDRK